MFLSYWYKKYNIFLVLFFSWYELFPAFICTVNTGSLSNTHSAKLRPDDVLRASPKDVLWTSPDGPLCRAKGRPLPPSLGRPLPTSLGRWNMASWGRPLVLHTVLYVTPWDVSYRCLENVSCRRYEDVPIRSNI